MSLQEIAQAIAAYHSQETVREMPSEGQHALFPAPAANHCCRPRLHREKTGPEIYRRRLRRQALCYSP